MMLVSIVALFLICSLDYLVIDLLTYFNQAYPPFWDQLGNFLLTVNSAGNFIIYCAFGRKFRQEFVAMMRQVVLCRREARPQRVEFGSMRIIPDLISGTWSFFVFIKVLFKASARVGRHVRNLRFKHLCVHANLYEIVKVEINATFCLFLQEMKLVCGPKERLVSLWPEIQTNTLPLDQSVTVKGRFIYKNNSLLFNHKVCNGVVTRVSLLSYIFTYCMRKFDENVYDFFK